MPKNILKLLLVVALIGVGILGILNRDTVAGTFGPLFIFNKFTATAASSATYQDVQGDVIISGDVGIGITNPAVPLHAVSSSSVTAPLLLETLSTYDTFSILPHNGRTYFSYGIYYKNGSWVHDSTNSSNALLAIQPDSGAYWYDSNNSTSSWNVASNVRLWTAAGVLTGASSRSLKENFTPLNPDEILEKISQLDVSQWNYKSEGPSVTHIGPTSEDFYQLFKTGDSDKTIGLIDESGVALAGVKGLIEKTKTQQQQIDKLQEKIDVLEKEIQQLKNR